MGEIRLMATVEKRLMDRHADLLVHQKGAKEFTPEQRSVLEAMDRWIEAVTGGDPEKVASLYAPDAVFWGTVSPFLRTTPEGVADYFRHFLRLPHLNAIYFKPMVRVYGDIALNTGYYTFFYEEEGTFKQIPARYTFVYRKDESGEWKIIEHHSSAVP